MGNYSVGSNLGTVKSLNFIRISGTAIIQSLTRRNRETNLNRQGTRLKGQPDVWYLVSSRKVVFGEFADYVPFLGWVRFSSSV
jgi:hypothetical protein